MFSSKLVMVLVLCILNGKQQKGKLVGHAVSNCWMFTLFFNSCRFIDVFDDRKCKIALWVVYIKHFFFIKCCPLVSAYEFTVPLRDGVFIHGAKIVKPIAILVRRFFFSCCDKSSCFLLFYLTILYTDLFVMSHTDTPAGRSSDPLCG